MSLIQDGIANVLGDTGASFGNLTKNLTDFNPFASSMDGIAGMLGGKSMMMTFAIILKFGMMLLSGVMNGDVPLSEIGTTVNSFLDKVSNGGLVPLTAKLAAGGGVMALLNGKFDNDFTALMKPGSEATVPAAGSVGATADEVAKTATENGATPVEAGAKALVAVAPVVVSRTREALIKDILGHQPTENQKPLTSSERFELMNELSEIKSERAEHEANVLQYGAAYAAIVGKPEDHPDLYMATESARIGTENVVGAFCDLTGIKYEPDFRDVSDFVASGHFAAGVGSTVSNAIETVITYNPITGPSIWAMKQVGIIDTEDDYKATITKAEIQEHALKIEREKAAAKPESSSGMLKLALTGYKAYGIAREQQHQEAVAAGKTVEPEEADQQTSWLRKLCGNSNASLADLQAQDRSGSASGASKYGITSADVVAAGGTQTGAVIVPVDATALVGETQEQTRRRKASQRAI